MYYPNSISSIFSRTNLIDFILVYCFLVAFPYASAFSESTSIDSAIPDYKKGADLRGSLNSIGSDSLNNLMTLWIEKFRSIYPNITIQVEGKGSGTAPPALINGVANLAPMSREMKSSESQDFEKTFGYKPTCIKIAVDALGVFVNKDNPISSLSLSKLDAIFSKTRRAGEIKNIVNWGELGLKGELANRRISIYGRNSASGTYGFFKSKVLLDGDYKDEVKEQPGSSAVVQSVSVDKFGIGYSGIGYTTSGVKAIFISESDDETPVSPSAQNAYSGNYPLSRHLYIYINKSPKKELEVTTKEFLKFVLSRNGQTIVIKDGYYPITNEMYKEEIQKLE